MLSTPGVPGEWNLGEARRGGRLLNGEVPPPGKGSQIPVSSDLEK